MRKQLLSVFLPLLLLGLMASAAETPAPQQNELQRVNVVRGTDDIRVEINARGAIAPKLSTADSPMTTRTSFCYSRILRSMPRPFELKLEPLKWHQQSSRPWV